jgi:two-component system, OmpR family, response regulator
MNVDEGVSVRLLVVEDEERLAAVLHRGLAEEGYAVDIAEDGPDAVWQATEIAYDGIVLDVMLPGLDGFEVCRSLRTQDCRTPVLMLTARGDVTSRIAGLDVGADDYLPKPFVFAELAARVRALVRRGPLTFLPELRVGDVRLEPATHRAFAGARQVDLTAKEFALLEAFMRQPDEALSRARLLDLVWDFAYDGKSNVVDQYVRHLRVKLGRSSALTQIETVRGVGYRLRGPSSP